MDGNGSCDPPGFHTPTESLALSGGVRLALAEIYPVPGITQVGLEISSKERGEGAIDVRN